MAVGGTDSVCSFFSGTFTALIAVLTIESALIAPLGIRNGGDRQFDRTTVSGQGDQARA